MSFRRLLLAATLLAAPFAAGAQPVEGLYLGAGAGLNIVPDASSNGVRLRTQDVGAAAVLSLGWGFGNGWRAEIEGNYRTDEVDRISLNGARIGSSGYYDKYGVMTNLLFDFDLSSFGIAPSTYQPYLGFGGGSFTVRMGLAQRAADNRQPPVRARICAAMRSVRLRSPASPPPGNVAV